MRIIRPGWLTGLLGEKNELKNRHLHIRWEKKQDIESEKQDIESIKQDIEGQKQEPDIPECIVGDELRIVQILNNKERN